MRPSITPLDPTATHRLLAPADVPTVPADRRRGLLGRDRYRRVLVLQPARQIHTFGMRFEIDVAWCDRSGTVLRVASVPPNRLSAWVPRAHRVLEAEVGTFTRLAISPGDRLACLPVGGGEGTWLVKCPPNHADGQRHVRAEPSGDDGETRPRRSSTGHPMGCAPT